MDAGAQCPGWKDSQEGRGEVPRGEIKPQQGGLGMRGRGDSAKASRKWEAECSPLVQNF